MKISLNGGQIILLVIFSIMGWMAISAASLYLIQHGEYYLGVMIWGCVPTSMILTLVLLMAITRNIE